MQSRTTWKGWVLAAVALLSSGCVGREAEPAPPDPVQILSASADRMENVGSFAFAFGHEDGTTTIGTGLQMVTAEGRMAGFDRLQAEVRALAGPLTVDVEIIVLPEGSWMTNPLTRAWGATTLSVSQLSSVPGIMRGIPEATLVGVEAVEGGEANRVEADVPTEQLLGLVPDAATGRTIHVRFWVGTTDPVLHRLEIAGPVKDGEAETIVRRLSFSEFGVPVTIVPPL
jgi:hypothetical protein